jgi:hypothetical protein
VGCFLLSLLLGPPAPEVSPKEVAAWEVRLSSDSYYRREKATARLISLGEKAAPLCRALAKSHDPEVRRRAEKAESEVRQASDAKFDWSQYEPFPFLDSAYYMPYRGGHPGTSPRWYKYDVLAYPLLSPYIDREKSEYGHLPVWGSYRVASKLWAEDALRAGYSPSFIKHCFEVW